MNLEILKKFVFTICLIGLIFESYVLYKDYQNYQTVVTVNIEKQSVVDYPGVSICESNHFINVRMNSILQSFPIPKGIWITAKQRDPFAFDQIINGEIEHEKFLRFFLSEDLISKDVFGPIDDGFITCRIKDTDEPCTPVKHVYGYFSECTSFFNTIYSENSSRIFKIADNSRNDEMAVFQIKKNHSNDYHSNQLTVLVIRSQYLPLYSIQKLAFRQNQLKFGRQYDVTFSKSTIIKLPKPYQTGCYNYQKNEDVKSYMECVMKCIYRTIYKKYKCLPHGSDIILNDEFDDKRLCNYKQMIKLDFNSLRNLTKRCKNEICLPDCTYEIYNYEIKDVTDSPSFFNEKVENDTITIYLLPQNSDEFTYIHQPKITRNDLFSKFGGLLSLWLGFSFFAIYSHIECFVKTQILKKVC